jgi:hypothetical protein
MNQRHLTDDQLVEMCLPGDHGRPGQDHLVVCPACEVRRAALAQLLSDVTIAAAAEADEAFSAERLSRQQARILQRIEQDGRPARVIAFPAGHPQGPSLLRQHPTSRWVAAAAAAAFIMGLLAGHLAHDFPGQRATRIATAAPVRPTGTTLRAATIPVSDEEFLDEIEIASGSAGPAALRRIDALTPRAWETR